MCAPPASASAASEPTAIAIRLISFMATSLALRDQASLPSTLRNTRPPLGDDRATIGCPPPDRQDPHIAYGSRRSRVEFAFDSRGWFQSLGVEVQDVARAEGGIGRARYWPVAT